jgi:hypothetical protein
MFEGELLKQSKNPRQLKVENHWREALYFDNDSFKRDTGLDVYAIRDFRPKMAMLLSWKEGSLEKRQRLTNFVKQYKEEGISAFINILENENSDELILDIGEKNNPENAKVIFSKISELTLCVEKISNELAEAFIDTANFTENQVEGGRLAEAKKIALKSIGKITSRINEIISTFHGIIISQEEVSDEEVAKFISNLENSKTEILMLSALLKTAKENKVEINFEMIKNLKLEKRVIGEKDEKGEEIKLSEEEKEEMMKMVEKNYREVVYPDNKVAAEAVIRDFREELAEGLAGQIIYTLKFQGKLAAFVRFKKLNDEEVYAGSLNVDQEVNNLCIGKYFTGSVLPEVARQFRIRAITRANNPVIPMYKKQGFAIDKDNPFEKNGERYYNMVMEKKG